MVATDVSAGESVRDDVQVEPDGEATLAFGWGRDGVQATRAEVEQDAEIVVALASDGLIDAAQQLEAGVPSAWLAEHGPGLAARLRPGEVIREQQFWWLRIPRVELLYRVSGIDHVLSLEGKRLLAPAFSEQSAFNARADNLKVLAVATLALFAAGAAAYLFRGMYFWNQASLFLVATFAAMLAALYRAAWCGSLGLRSTRAWMAGSTVLLLATSVAGVLGEPTLGQARALAERGELAAARTIRDVAVLGTAEELAALDALIRDKELGQLLQRCLGLEDLSAATEAANKLPAGSAHREAASQHVDELAEAGTHRSISAHDSTGAGHTLAKASETFRSSARGRQLAAEIEMLAASEQLEHERWKEAIGHADAAIQLGSGEMALVTRRSEIIEAMVTKAEHLSEVAAREKDRTQRKHLAEEAEALWKIWEEAGGGPEPTMLSSLRKLLAVDRAAIAADASRKAKKEQARVARAAAAAEHKVEWHAPRYSGPHCTKGCPCGNSCISCSKQCHK